jgi:hypothetical protein
VLAWDECAKTEDDDVEATSCLAVAEMLSSGVNDEAADEVDDVACKPDETVPWTESI